MLHGFLKNSNKNISYPKNIFLFFLTQRRKAAKIEGLIAIKSNLLKKP